MRVRTSVVPLAFFDEDGDLVLGHALDGFQKSNLTPIIGTEFARGVQVAQWLMERRVE